MLDVIVGDCREVLKTLPAGSVHCCVTSPPYFGLRDYGVAGQMGLEPTPDEFVGALVSVFREVRRVLRDDGTLWLNLGDSYAGSWGAQSRPNGSDNKSTLGGGSMLSARQIAAHPKGTHTGSLKNTPGLKPKDLIGIPWRVAFALQVDGWYLRQDIIWAKPNPMPESVRDRCTKAHEYIFMLSKNERYYYDNDAVAEPVADATVARIRQPNLPNQRGSNRVPGKTNGNMKAVVRKQDGVGKARYSGFNDRYAGAERGPTRNKRSVWTVTTKPFKGAHFATFPPDLIEPCVLAGCPVGGTVLDPFNGAGTTGLVAQRNGRSYVGIELNPAYAQMSRERWAKDIFA